MIMIFISNHISWNLLWWVYHLVMKTYNCKKCGLTISSTCSKCDRVVDVEILDDGCIVQKTKCGECANTPVVKDICAQQK